MTDPALQETIAANLARLHADIAKARTDIDLPADGVEIMAVSKRQPLDRLDAALAAGHRLFGENRVEEAQEKWPDLRQRYPGTRLHLIGGLQSRKTAEAVSLFDMIETLDRPKLARKLASEMAEQKRRVPLLIQVNTGEEDQKGGVLPADLESLLTLARDELELPVEGLMCIPPVDEDPALHFAFLATLARRHGLKTLSMGMSGDYAQAAAAGANWVRIGTAVFGPRPS